METGLRIVLLLVAGLIIAGIIWDTFRSRRKPSIKKAKQYKLDRVSNKKKENLEFNDFSNFNGHPAFEEDMDLLTDLNASSAVNSEMHLLTDEVVVIKPSKSSQNNTRNKSKSKAESKVNIPSPSSRLEKLDDFKDDVRVISKPEVTPSIFVMNVMAKQPGSFSGKKLIEVFDELHLYYGEMQIFHRYENNDGSGKPMFSLASAIEPGVFELATLESYITPGLTLFFSSTTRNHSIAAFELMLRTAKMLASALDGELKDQSRRPLTLEGIEKYRQDVRESVKLHRASSALFST